MAAPRVSIDRILELIRLHRRGFSARSRARLLAMGVNTQRLYCNLLKDAGLLDGNPDDVPEPDAVAQAIDQRRARVLPPQQTSSAARYLPRIEALMDTGLDLSAIYRQLAREDDTFTASLEAVKRARAAILRNRRQHEQRALGASMVVPREEPSSEHFDGSSSERAS